MHVCLFTANMFGAHGCQKKAIDSQKQKVQMVVSAWVLGFEPGSSGRVFSTFKCGAISPSTRGHS